MEVFSDRGKAKLRARLTEIVPPGAVNLEHGWSPTDYIEGHYSELYLGIDDLTQSNPTLNMEPIVSDLRAGGHTLTYDCLVEVRSAEGESDTFNGTPSVRK